MHVPAFFYGSYMDPDVLRRFGARPGHAVPALLRGWRITFTPHANLVPDARATVHGFLFHLPHDELERLYGPAGFVTTYKPVPIAVDSSDGAVVAMTYVELADEQAPDGAYLESFLGICGRLGLPDDYVREIRSRADGLVKGTLA